MKRIIIVGAGPGGMAAAAQLLARERESLDIVLVERQATAEFLPGTIATALGQTSAADWQQPLHLPGITLRAGEVTRVSGQGIILNGAELAADFVIAAPGLALDTTAVPDFPTVFPFWSPSSAENASHKVQSLQNGRLAVIVAGLPYRCPPAPFSLAMQLAYFFRQKQRDVQVFVTTPEERPLAPLGGGIPEHVEQSCAVAGVTLHTAFHPDWAASSQHAIASSDGRSAAFDLALVVPPHVRAPMLSRLPGDGPLVTVSEIFESDAPNLFVVGDAAKTPFPRAAGAATAQGKTAANAVLARLGLIEPAAPHAPEPECYIGHGGGLFSKIALRYPNGLPPAARPEVSLAPPSHQLADEFAAAFITWKRQRHIN